MPCACSRKFGDCQHQYCGCHHHVFTITTASRAYPAANLLEFLSFSPNFHKMKGAGTPSPIAMKPSTLLPHPNPSASFIAGANSGNPKPAKLLNTVAAAMALAAYRVYESISYVLMH